MDFRVLGQLHVVDGGRDLTPSGRLQRAVLLRLLVDANSVVAADVLIDDVFDGDQPQNPGAAIQVHLSRLRKALAGADSEAGDLITSVAPGYQLCLGPQDVDSWRFEHLVEESATASGQAGPEATAERLTTALALWRGPALGDFNDAQWARSEVVRLEELRLGAIESLFEARLALGGHHEMVSQLRSMAEEHPMRERLWGQLMRALYLDGRQAEALRAYQEARRVLDNTVGLAPCRELQDLEQAILRQDLALHQPPPATEHGAAPIGQVKEPVAQRLPRPLTRFVGRETAKTEIITLLSKTRLVTLTGMAGVGKTRLGLEVASDLVDTAPSCPVRLVELAAVCEPRLMVAAVGAAVGATVVARPGADFADIEALARAIGQSGCVLLLDNCEHLRDACAELAVGLLSRCTDLRILATSQEALGVPGEAAWQVPPLSVPAPDAPDRSLLDLLGEESVQLFCDRAALVRPGFALDDDNCDIVATICRRLDGLPLAIELAAATVAMLSVQEVSTLLDDRFNLLTVSSRWVTARHQTLLAAVDWSHDLLSHPEQVLLRRLAVFSGGATLGAIEEVCAGPELAPSEIFGLVSGLVAKSLVVADTSGHQARYRLLETVRFFASDRLLESGEHNTVAEHHVRWCVGLAERAEPELTGADELVWRERLWADLDNVRAALQCAIADAHGALALRLSAALTLFWVRTGQGHEGRRWLEKSLALGTDPPPRLRAKALWGVGQACLQVGDGPAAAVAAAESLALWRSCGDGRGQARALLVMACAGSSTAESLEEASKLARDAGDLWCLSQSLVMSGWGRLRGGRPRSAEPCFDEAIRVARLAKGQFELIPGLIGLGSTALVIGDYQAAQRLLDEAEALCRRLDVPREGTVTLCRLAQLAMGRGDQDTPSRLLREALGMAVQLGSPDLEMQCHLLMGRLALDVGDITAAQRSFEQAGDSAGMLGSASTSVLVGLSDVHLASGDVDAARTSLSDAFSVARANGNLLDLARVVSRIGDLAAGDTDIVQAVACHRRALSERAAADNQPGVACSLESVASLAVRQHEPLRAARLFAAADALRTAGGYVRPPGRHRCHQADMAALREQLPPEQLARAWSDGAALSVSDAVALAMDDALSTEPDADRAWGD